MRPPAVSDTADRICSGLDKAPARELAHLLQRVLGPEGPRRSTVVSTVLQEVQRKFFTLAEDADERGVPLVGGLKGVNVTR